MNSGNIGDSVLGVTVIDEQGRVKLLKRKDIRFGYRNSNLIRYIILGAFLKLIKKDKRGIKKKIKEHLDYRQKTQDLSWPSAGCIFKNPSFDALRLLRIDPERSRMGPNSKSALRLRSELIVSDHPLNSGMSRVKSRDRDERSAAYFIERCGLKGSSFGDAAVSSKHANFIINKGKASFVDILKLITYITSCVKKKFNLDLEPEITIWK